MSHKIFGEYLRRKISNWKWRIGTSEARSVLPICLSVEFIKIDGTTEDGLEKPLRAHWPDQGRSPV
jgi:hypothetical protein